MFIRLMLSLILFSTVSFAQAVRPPNSLEQRRAHDIEVELSRVQAEAAQATKQVKKAQAAVSAAQANLSAANSALAAYSGADPKVKAALSSNAEHAAKSLAVSQQQLARAQRNVTEAPKRVARVQAAQADWNRKVLHAHRADDGKHSVNWAKSLIESR